MRDSCDHEEEYEESSDGKGDLQGDLFTQFAACEGYSHTSIYTEEYLVVGICIDIKVCHDGVGEYGRVCK